MTELHFKAIYGQNMFELTQDYEAFGYVSKAGRRTNLANIPWPVRFFLNIFDYRIINAAVIHDDLYETATVSRFHADLVFIMIMHRDRAEWYLILLAFAGVRLLGAKHYGAKN